MQIYFSVCQINSYMKYQNICFDIIKTERASTRLWYLLHIRKQACVAAIEWDHTSEL